jgi:hypothetical protein
LFHIMKIRVANSQASELVLMLMLIQSQCLKIRQNKKNRTSPIPSVFEKFSKNR